MLKRLSNIMLIIFFIFVVILIIYVNVKEARNTKKREFKTIINGGVAYIGYEFYTYEHDLKMQDPNDDEIFFLAMDSKDDGELRFTIIDKENIPKGHFLERYANWEQAEIIYNKMVSERNILNKNNTQKI